MNSKLMATILLALALAAAPFVAREPVPIINYDNVPIVSTSGKVPRLEQVKADHPSRRPGKGMVDCLSGRWQIFGDAYRAQQHTIVVEIIYTAEQNGQ